MRKIRSSPRKSLKSEHVRLTSHQTPIEQLWARDLDRVERGPQAKKFAIRGHSGTNFEMEGAFWDRLDRICATEGWPVGTFVERAEDRFPELPRVEAVRSAIVDYMADCAWQTPHAYHTLHEAGPQEPQSVEIAITSMAGRFKLLPLYSRKN